MMSRFSIQFAPRRDRGRLNLGLLIALLLLVWLAWPSSPPRTLAADQSNPAVAGHSLDQAVGYAEKLDDQPGRAELEALLAGVFGKVGDPDAYRAHSGRAIALTLGKSQALRDSVLWTLAEAHAKAGRMTKAFITAGSASKSYFVISAYVDIAEAAAERGDQQASRRAIAAALAAYQHAEPDFARQAALFSLAHTLASNQRYDQIVQLARQSASPSHAAEALAHAATIAGERGDHANAKKLLAKARRRLSHREVKGKDTQSTRALEQARAAMVRALAAQGRMDDARNLSNSIPQHTSAAALARLALVEHQNGKAKANAWARTRTEIESIEDAYTRAWLWHQVIQEVHGTKLLDKPEPFIHSLPTPLERAYAALAFAQRNLPTQ